MKRSRFMDQLPEEMDELCAHRLRKIRKVEGQFPAFVYLNPKVGDRLKSKQKYLLEFFTKKGVKCQIVQEPHISLSRIVKLSYVQIDPFIKTFKNQHLPLLRRAPLYLKEAHYNCVVSGVTIEEEQERSTQHKNHGDKDEDKKKQDQKQQAPLKMEEVYVGLSAGAHLIPFIKNIDLIMSKYDQPKYNPPIVSLSLIRVQGDLKLIEKWLQQISTQHKSIQKVNASLNRIYIRIDKKSYEFDLK